MSQISNCFDILTHTTVSNPHITAGTTLNQLEVSVWDIISSFDVLGLYFLKEW
jgi:hypothetical protein